MKEKAVRVASVIMSIAVVAAGFSIFICNDTHANAENAENLPTALVDEPVTTVAGITIKGGTQGVDFTYGNVTYTRLQRGNSETQRYQDATRIATSTTVSTTLPTLSILTDTPLTLSGSTNANIRVAKGVHADVTLSGFSCTGMMPINIETNSTISGNVATQSSGSQIQNKTSLYLHVQSGTSNTLQSAAFSDSVARNTYDYQFAGIRCGEGSELVIDSTDPSTTNGRLVVRGGSRASAIGGGPLEAAGDITINGSTIDAKASGQYGLVSAHGAGAGIGGGHAGSGGNITINGGNITAMGGYHGAPIGGGCTYNGGMSGGSNLTAPFADAILSRHACNPLAGNITINGGYIRAVGTEHSNAFGKGCGNDGTGQIIRITGGTLLPSSYSGWKDIGLPNGYVIITGGSVNCTADKFEGVGNTAYNTTDVTTWDDITNKHQGALPDADKVFMVTIDMSSEGFVDDVITSWKLYINNEEQEYGTPYSFDKGKLYLWLPDSAIGKEIKVEMEIKTESGDIIKPGDLFIPDVSGSGSILKRYEPFVIPEAYLTKLTKPYDGLPIPQYASTDGVLTLVHTIDGNTALTDLSQLKYTYQLFDDDGELTGSATSVTDAAHMPIDAADYQIAITSNEYSRLPGFSNSYWGHRQYVTSSISRVPSDTAVSAAWKQGHEINHSTSPVLVITADITSGTFDDGTSTSSTCKSPTGTIVLDVEGIGTIDLPIIFDGEGKNAETVADDNGREHTIVTYELTDTSKIQEDGEYRISASYSPAKNYLSSGDEMSFRVDTTIGMLPHVGKTPSAMIVSNALFLIILVVGSVITARRTILIRRDEAS